MNRVMNSDLIDFCETYNLPFQHLGAVLKDPKVIPMIRGKAFEFSVNDYLSNMLDKSIWKVTKPYLNPQLNSHDEDVLIEHIATQRRIRIECKLAAKGEYAARENESIFKIKCMRSRTLGESQVEKLHESRGLEKSQLSVHNDQYLPSDFDLVITSLANAFYSTSSEGIFIWNPSRLGQAFLNQKFGENLSAKQYQDAAFFDMYVAKASDLAIVQGNGITCTRRKCTNSNGCGFIPNYPLLKFNHNDLVNPSNKWVHINNIERILMDFLV